MPPDDLGLCGQGGRNDELVQEMSPARLPNGSAFSGARRPRYAPRKTSEVAILPCSGTAQREHIRCNGGGGSTRMSESEGWIPVIVRG